MRNVDELDLPLNQDLFMRKLIRELTCILEETVGMEEASSYVNIVGGMVGEWIHAQYRDELEVETLPVEQLARVLVDLKRRIGGDFYIKDIREDAIVLGNRRCPFGDYAKGREALCMMTSNVFGRIAADNLGYARVALNSTIARGQTECDVTIHLTPTDDLHALDREYHRRHRSDV